MGSSLPSGFERVISMRKAAADNATSIAHAAGLAALKAGLPTDQIVCMALDPHSDGFSNEGGSIVKYANSLQVRSCSPFLLLAMFICMGALPEHRGNCLSASLPLCVSLPH